MKKILCLVLLVLLMPCVAVFNGCGDKGYKLSNATTAIADMDKYQSVVVEDATVRFSYDSFTSGESKYINDILATNIKPYSYLKDYNNLFNNIMAFTFEYLDECANDDIDVPKDIRNRLESQLASLDNDIANVDTATIGWADAVYGAGSNIASLVSVAKFKNLLVFYDDLFISASNVANTVSTIYFGYILNDANPNYYDINLADFDASMVANKLEARILDQLSNITQVYIEKNIRGGDLADQLTDVTVDFGNLDLTQYNARIQAIANKLTVNEQTIARANANKENFYNTAIELYNIQEVLADNGSIFIKACNDIEYKKMVADDNASNYDKMCVEIIDSHDNLISQYNEILARLLTMMGV
ncbi:MAG: hypothetical protein ACLRFL_00230 [Clostridia bacterium]